jgi:hypothetical protein
MRRQQCDAMTRSISGRTTRAFVADSARGRCRNAAFSAAASSAGGGLRKFLRWGRGGGGEGGGSGGGAGTSSDGITNNSSITSSPRRHDDEVDNSINLAVSVPSRNAAAGVGGRGGHHRPLSTSSSAAPVRAVDDDVDLARWSSLSVKAAMAIMSAGGGDAIARRAVIFHLRRKNTLRLKSRHIKHLSY